MHAADEGASSRSAADGTSKAVGRTYDYVTEDHCDATKDIFLHSIQTAADTPGQGFAAIKVSLLPGVQQPLRFSLSLSLSLPFSLSSSLHLWMPQ